MRGYSIAGGLLAVMCAWGVALAATNAPEGAGIFSDVCAKCHGPTGEGGLNAPKIAGLSAKDALIRLRAFAATSTGNVASRTMEMVAKSLSPEQRQAAAAYVGSLTDK